MNDIPRPIDTPDRWDTGMEPPYNKRVRHGEMSVWAEGTIWTVALMIAAGFIGGLMAYISGVIE